MAHIHRLDPSLVNKIAAGEVIERPASVVKELVENALDAGASRIDVALEDGGAALIRVTDDGCGIPAAELPLAVAPHATSKISDADDLFNVGTLGFRGEALASIASVSDLRLRSRPAEQEEGHEILVRGGHPESPAPCSAPVGTTVEVRRLFYNVPARRKFLRQPPTEFSHVTEQIARLALAHPNVAFSLSHNGRSARNLPVVSDRRARIGDFYGTDLAECLIAVDRQERGLRIEALMAPPANARATSKWQYLFLNGRFITDRRIGFSIREAFRGLVEHDRYPVVFIFLTTPPDAYDVNVHPTKIEVRWRDGGLVQSQVLAVLRETLLSLDLTPAASLHGAAPYSDRRPPFDPSRRRHAREVIAEYLKSIDPNQARLTFSPPPVSTTDLRPSIGSVIAPPVAASPAAAPSDAACQSSAPSNGSIPQPPVEDPAWPALPGDNIPSPAAAHADDFGARPVLQVHNTYIVAQAEDGMVIIDQHALHERILYERFRERVLAGPLESQRLLIPPAVDVSPDEARAAEEHADLLRTLGIELSSFGPKALAVQSLPVLMGEADPVELVRDLLDRLAEHPRTDETAADSPAGFDRRESLLHAVLDMMACKAAVKAGDPLTQDEMVVLLAQRHLIARSSNCPHGRPTTLQLSTRDLERQFKRI